MPRLRHTRTGVVVSVDDVAAAGLGPEWGDPDAVPVAPSSHSPGPAPATASGEPRGNGSREEWAAYADSLGVTYDPEAKRGDIKDAIAAAADVADGDDSTSEAPEDVQGAPEGDDK